MMAVAVSLCAFCASLRWRMEMTKVMVNEDNGIVCFGIRKSLWRKILGDKWIKMEFV